MTKRSVAIFLLVVFVMGNAVAFAHLQPQHSADLKKVLFGDEYKYLSKDQNTAFNAIAHAAAFTIDQFSSSKTQEDGTYKKLLNELDELGIKAKITKFRKVDLNFEVDKNNISATTHRKYTHLGWDYENYPNQEFWLLRKQMLIDTVNWVLFNRDAKFSWIKPLYKPSKQCEAFSAVIYYVHILGDHVAGDTPRKLENLEPLLSIIIELKEQLGIVFASQKNSRKYKALEDELSAFIIKVQRNYNLYGVECKINKKYAKDLLERLAEHIPKLLQEEEFFRKYFKQVF